MDSESAEIDRVRQRLVEFLENDRWEMLSEDEVEARELLKRYGHCGNQYDIIDFLLSLLQENYPMSAVPLTNPRYRPGTG